MYEEMKGMIDLMNEMVRADSSRMTCSDKVFVSGSPCPTGTTQACQRTWIGFNAKQA